MRNREQTESIIVAKGQTRCGLPFADYASNSGLIQVRHAYSLQNAGA